MALRNPPEQSFPSLWQSSVRGLWSAFDAGSVISGQMWPDLAGAVAGMGQRFCLSPPGQGFARRRACGCGEIGRRTRFRFWRRKAWGFKSLHPHHFAPAIMRRITPYTGRKPLLEGARRCAGRLPGAGKLLRNRARMIVGRTSPHAGHRDPERRPQARLYHHRHGGRAGCEGPGKADRGAAGGRDQGLPQGQGPAGDPEKAVRHPHPGRRDAGSHRPIARRCSPKSRWSAGKPGKRVRMSWSR